MIILSPYLVYVKKIDIIFFHTLLMQKIVQTLVLKQGMKAIGPYSVGKIFNNTLYLSGQLGFNPETSKLVSDSVEEQTDQTLKNIKSILTEANSSMENIIKCIVYLVVY